MAAEGSGKLWERLAGAGAGTSLVGLVNSFPAGFDGYRSGAVYLCPIAGMLIGVIWAYSVTTLKERSAVRSIKGTLTELRILHANAIEGGHSSSEHINMIWTKIEELEVEFASALANKAKGINIHLKV